MNYELILKFPEASAALSADLLADVLDRLVAGAPLSEIEALLQAQAAAEVAAAAPLQAAAPDGTSVALTVSRAAVHEVTEAQPLGSALSSGADGRAQAELSISFEIGEELFRELFGRASALAERLGMELFDPQLSRIVTAADAERVAERWGELRAYVLRSRGLDALLMKGEPLMLPPPTFLERHWKMVALGVGILLAFLIIRRTLELLS